MTTESHRKKAAANAAKRQEMEGGFRATQTPESKPAAAPEPQQPAEDLHRQIIEDNRF